VNEERFTQEMGFDMHFAFSASGIGFRHFFDIHVSMIPDNNEEWPQAL